MESSPVRRRRGLLAALSVPALCAASLVSSDRSIAQPAPANGPRDIQPGWHALVHATLVPRPGEKVEDATIIIRDGVIQGIAPGGAAPEGARVWDYTGLTVYAGLIDAHVPVDSPAPDRNAPGAHWNPKVTPERSALHGEGVDKSTRESLRKMGFTAAAIAPKGGVFRGMGAVVTLADPPSDSEAGVEPISAGAFHELVFATGGFNSSDYPNSQMGAIALMRQTLADAEWREADLSAYNADPASRSRPMPADALDALRARNPEIPLVFDTEDELEALRAAKIAREFGRPAIIVGSGTEFRRLDAIKADGLAFILPLRFPEAPKVATEAEAESVSLADLMTWEQAPTNPRRLDNAGVPVALTTDKLKKRDEFAKNLQSAIKHGLTPDRALAMLTTNPAKILGVEDRLGEVAPGRIANLVVVKGELFDKKGEIRDVWVDGRRHEIKSGPAVEPAGQWAAKFGGPVDVEGTITIKDQEGKAPTIAIKAVEEEYKARSVALVENRLSFLVDDAKAEAPGTYTLSAVLDGEEMIGSGVSPTGERFTWSATRSADAAETTSESVASTESAEGEDGDKKKADEDNSKDDAAEDDKPAEVPEALGRPFGAYATTGLPPQEDLVVTNATIWTSGPAGVIENGWLHVRDGRIVGVGAGSAPSAGRTIDAGGRHVTPGLIDCHSHTGVSGSVNEGTQAVTAEVRIFDVIDPDAVGWYRELAGGLTAANQLHGSANPIGGQNSVVKLRWGVATPDEMRLEGAPSGIKFALGENVKQANWGERFSTRYPQTRMGVETIIRDGFIAARDYTEQWKRYNALPTGERERTAPPRRDLELEALAEILAGERLVHCHSYRQDEILMLCRVAADFGFQIGTFQHVLEGYKVADAIKEVARGGSSFSDWWAYKVEVIDAIPENGAIMNEVGVTVSFNSDSDELARRMNGEAAKAVKYGGVSPAEALKFVTLNPAIQLGVEDRVGSLEKGKDADFVIWSGDPLSSMTRCEATYIDSREYFSLAKDREMRERNTAERARLIQKALADGKKKDKKGAKDGAEGGGPGEPAKSVVDTPTTPRDFETQRLWDLVIEQNLRLLRAGVDPEAHRCGDCGVLNVHSH